jgi:hypothetical protein
MIAPPEDSLDEAAPLLLLEFSRSRRSDIAFKGKNNSDRSEQFDSVDFACWVNTGCYVSPSPPQTSANVPGKHPSQDVFVSWQREIAIEGDKNLGGAIRVHAVR